MLDYDLIPGEETPAHQAVNTLWHVGFIRFDVPLKSMG